MPRTVTILDPRPRTQSIHLDLVSPDHYRIRVIRETVEQDADTGEIVKRTVTRMLDTDVTFDANGVPSGRPGVLALLAPIQAEVEAMEADDIAAKAAAAAARDALARDAERDLPMPGP